MRPTENIKRLIKHAKIKTNPDVNEAVLKDLLNELDKSESVRSAANRPNLWRMIAKSRITKMAVAAGVMIAIGLFLFGRNAPEMRMYQANAINEPVKMLTVLSLRHAYDAGGMEAVERQCNEAYKKLNLRPDDGVSMRELFN